VTGRVPAGVPTGGQFAASAHTESEVTLADSAPHEEYAVSGETRQSTAPFDRLHLETTNRSARELARLVEEGQIDASPPYQRGSVWNLDQRIALVKSWLQGVPVPAVMVNDRTSSEWHARYGDENLSTGQGMWAVVDGKQRLETARMWFGDEFAVPASWFPADDVDTTIDTPDGLYVCYSGLTKRGQTVMAMGGSMQPMTTAKLDTIEAEADLYLLVNGGGTAQTEADMAHAASYASTAPKGTDQ
jgi:hypothetical protein